MDQVGGGGRGGGQSLWTELSCESELQARQLQEGARGWELQTVVMESGGVTHAEGESRDSVGNGAP